MVRKLLKSLLSLSLIAPLSAFALGLGDVHLHSALSERLQADIDLLSVSSDEADSISVSLASHETFAKVGLERPAILMFLKFEVVQGSAGGYVIKVTSVEPINEPYLDFLVEVEWKAGRVLREYTLLLDPPSSYRETAPAVTTPAAETTWSTPSPAPVTAPAATTPTTTPSTDTAAAESDYMYTEAPEIPGGTEQRDIAEAAAAKQTETAIQPVAASADTQMAPIAPVPAGGIVYGPVKAGDTLWRIAEKLRPNEDVTVQQMMIALVKANPYAFVDNNINRLKRGYVLRVDDPSMLTAMSKADAVREVARQTRAWQDYRESVAARAKQRPAATSAVEATPGAAAAAKSEPKLKLVTPEGKGTDSAAPSGTGEGKTSDEVSEELMLAMESSAAQRKENQALKGRLTALEGQLEDMENILTLKNADLAALQQQLREQGKDVELESEKKPVVAETQQDAEKTDLVLKPGEKALETSEDMASPEGEIKPEDTAQPEEKPAADEARPEVKPETTKPVAAEPRKPKRPKPVTMPVEEPGLIDTLMADTMMLGIVGGVVVFILILLMLLIKRRRKGGFQESILNTGGTSSMMKASDEQGSETSFLSDLAISGMGPGTIQTDEGEADPITEAEVFMAYGRNQQAEEVLKKAREVSPDRVDLAAKLLEVYHSSKDKEKFEALAEEAVGALQADDALWGKVLAMGHELCPDNVLFKAGAGAETPAAAQTAQVAAEPASGDVMDIGLDLDELSAEMEGEGGGGDMDLDLGLDFSDVDEGGASEEAASDELDIGMDLGLDEPEAAAEEGAGDLEMDLGAFDMDSSSDEGSADEGGLDFDVDLSASDEAVAEGGDEIGLDLGDLGASEADTDLGFDLDMGELTTEADEGAGDMSLDMDMDMGDLDLGTGAEAVDDSVSMDLDSELDDLGDLGDLMGDSDEISQKLDLAQAYSEMGDAEGARSMLEEVVADGNDEQKQQAQALIDKL